jgi:O-antigen ligase
VTASPPLGPGAGHPAESANDSSRGSTGSRTRRFADDFGAAVTEATWLVAMICLPIYFNIYSSRTFEPDKVALLKILAAVAAAAWLGRILAGGAVWPAGEPDEAGRRFGRLLVVVIAACALATGLSTLLSISPARSWHGSFFRQQGLTTVLAYLTLAAGVAGHLRRPDQWRRAVMAIVLGSVPVSVYAVVQRLGLDVIVPRGEGLRVGSSIGNPIFLGGYMAMVILVTLSSVPGWIRSPRLGARIGGGLALATVVGLQVASLVLTQSRGPVLGLGAGLVIAALAWSRRERARRWRRSVTTAVVVAVCLGVGLLAVVAATGYSVSFLRRLPAFGRLVSALDMRSPTAQVRLLIWRGVVELETVAPPLGGIHGERDRLHRLRPVVGYGPECFDLAFNRVYPSELGVVEDRRAVPDRAHSEPLDVLVTGGTVGLLAWLMLVSLALALAAARAGGMPDRAAVTRLWLLAAGGAVAVAAVAIAAGRAELAGALASVGLLGGLGAGLLLPWPGNGTSTSGGSSDDLALAVTAAMACHLVDASVGIPTTPGRSLFWFLLAALIADAFGRIARSEPLRAPDTGSGRHRELVAHALLAGIALAAMTLASMTLPIGEIARRVVAAGSVRDALVAAGTTLLVVGSSAIGVAVALVLGCRGHRPGLRTGLLGGAAMVCPSLVVGALMSSRLSTTAHRQRAGATFEELSIHVAGHAGVAMAAILAMALVLAVLLFRGRPGRGESPPRVAMAAAGALLTGFVVTAAASVASSAVAPIRADALVKHAVVVLDRGQALPALALLSRASWLAPREPSLLTHVARATVIASFQARSPRARQAAADGGVAALERAARLQPFDPDHAVNLGRVLTATALLAGDSQIRQSLLERAESSFARGLRMRPGSIPFRVEHAAALARIGRHAAAAAELAAAQAADPGYATAAVHETLALLYLETGQPERALAEALTAVRVAGPGDLPRAEATLTLVRLRTGRSRVAVPPGRP